MKNKLHSVFAIVFVAGLYLMQLNSAEARQTTFTTLDDTKPVFVIVHGAWGGSWAFRDVEMLLREQGYDVYRPSLTGLGERVHLAHKNVSLSTHIEDVINAILFEQLEDIVLVGHSYGGMVISGVAHRIPERIRSMIYLDAAVPNDGENLGETLGDRTDGIMNMEQDGFLVPRWVSDDQPPPKDVPHPVQTFLEPVELKNNLAWQIPTVYIHAVEPGTAAEEDAFYAQALRAQERGWPVIIIHSDHNPQWSAPSELAKLLHQNW